MCICVCPSVCMGTRGRSLWKPDGVLDFLELELQELGATTSFLPFHFLLALSILRGQDSQQALHTEDMDLSWENILCHVYSGLDRLLEIVLSAWLPVKTLRFYSFQSEFKTNTPGPICCLSPFRNLFNTHYATDLFNDN